MRMLFFSPFARIHPHSVPEATLSREFAKLGHEIEFITCGKIYQGQCEVLSALGIEYGSDKKILDKVCRECASCTKSLFPHATTLAKLHSLNNGAKEDFAGILEGLNETNIIDFVYEGLPIGKLAAYQHLLKFKKFTPEFTPTELPIIKNEVLNCLLTYQALVGRKSKGSPNPDFVFVYNTLYSVNAVVRYFYQREAVPVYSLHAGSNLHHFHDTLMLCKGDTVSHLKRLIAKWPKFKDQQLTKADVSWVTSHFHELSLGKSVFVYSSPTSGIRQDLRKRWNIPTDSKIVLVGMSSYDERFAAEFINVLSPSQDSLYRNQIEWLLDIKEHAERRPDLFFIIRIHPREFPNKRESRQSLHTNMILDALKDLPKNIVINTPEDKLSIYEIAREIDVALTAWSSVSKELMLLGIPVVFFTSDMQWFPTEKLKVGRTKLEYFRLIDEAIAEKWSFETAKEMFRWYVFESKRTLFKLSTNLSSSASKKHKLLMRILLRTRAFALLRFTIGEIRNDKKLSQFLADPDQFTLTEESLRPNSELGTENTEIINGMLQIAGLFWGEKENWPKQFTDICF